MGILPVSLCFRFFFFQECTARSRLVQHVYAFRDSFPALVSRKLKYWAIQKVRAVFWYPSKKRVSI